MPSCPSNCTALQADSNNCSTSKPTVFLCSDSLCIDPQVSLDVRLLLDGGSQKSYICERARNLLGLQAYRRAISLHCHLWLQQREQEVMSDSGCGNESEGLALNVIFFVCNANHLRASSWTAHISMCQPTTTSLGVRLSQFLKF